MNPERQLLRRHARIAHKTNYNLCVVRGVCQFPSEQLQLPAVLNMSKWRKRSALGPRD